MGFFDALFGGGSGVSTAGMQQSYERRLADINSFAGQLDAARAQYLTSVGNMYTQAFSQYMPQAEANFAGRGLQVNGGAYASALGRETAGYQAQLTPLAYQQQLQDLNNVQNLKGQAWNQMFQGMNQANMFNANMRAENSRAIGGFLGNLGATAVGTAMAGPYGGMSFGQRFAGNLGFNNYGNTRSPFGSGMSSAAGSGSIGSYNRMNLFQR